MTRSASDAPAPLASIEEMLDARVMGPRLRAALGTPRRTSCHVLDAKYEPGVRGTVLYRMGDLLVRGDLLTDPDEVRTSRVVVQPGVRLSCFPEDPDLPGLPAVTDPATLRHVLTEALTPGGPVLRCRVDLVRYRPGRRATLAVSARRPAARRANHLIAKCYHDDRKAAAVAAEAVQHSAAVDPSAPLRFAPVLAHLPDLSLVVQQHVGGVRLDEVVGRPGADAGSALRRSAAALAAFHRQPLITGRHRVVEAELARITARSRRVAAVAPAVGASLEELAGRLADTAREVPPGVVGPVHGDCKPSQFLLRGERDVVLLDLDSCGLADPAGDVGTFLATLRQHGLRDLLARRATPAGVRDRAVLADAFLDAYVGAAGHGAGADLRRRVAWYEAVALERKALRCFARAPRSPLTRALVGAGQTVLDRLEGTR